MGLSKSKKINKSQIKKKKNKSMKQKKKNDKILLNWTVGDCVRPIGMPTYYIITKEHDKENWSMNAPSGGSHMITDIIPKIVEKSGAWEGPPQFMCPMKSKSRSKRKKSKRKKSKRKKPKRKKSKRKKLS